MSKMLDFYTIFAVERRPDWSIRWSKPKEISIFDEFRFSFYRFLNILRHIRCFFFSQSKRKESFCLNALLRNRKLFSRKREEKKQQQFVLDGGPLVTNCMSNSLFSSSVSFESTVIVFVSTTNRHKRFRWTETTTVFFSLSSSSSKMSNKVTNTNRSIWILVCISIESKLHAPLFEPVENQCYKRPLTFIIFSQIFLSNFSFRISNSTNVNIRIENDRFISNIFLF